MSAEQDKFRHLREVANGMQTSDASSAVVTVVLDKNIRRKPATRTDAVEQRETVEAIDMYLRFARQTRDKRTEHDVFPQIGGVNIRTHDRGLIRSLPALEVVEDLW